MSPEPNTLDLDVRASPSGDADVSRTLDELHASTRELMRAKHTDEIAKIVVDAAYRILGFPGTGIRLYDAEKDALVSVSFDGEASDGVDSRPDFDVDSSPHGEAFRRGETVTYEVPDGDDPYGLDPFERTMYVPLGDHGVLSLGRKDDVAFDHADEQCAEILAANTRVALDRLERESELRERRRELERQNERLEQFASVVSHDMRNPINAAQGYLEFAEKEGDEDHFQKVDDALDRLQRLTSDLLTLARDGETVGECEYVDVTEVARDAWTAVETEEATLTLPDGNVVKADPGSLQRLFENLFRNAVMHVGPSVEVRVGLHADGFYVEDDGPGIPESERESVFEQGYTTATQGTGLGLAIVHNLTEAHDWTVHVEDGTDGGARFEIHDVACE